MANNFKCECGKEIFVPKYTTLIKEGKSVYKVDNRELLCECGKSMSYIEKEGPIGIPMFGKFASASREDKAKMLKERSKKDFKKNIESQRQEMSTNDKMY